MQRRSPNRARRNRLGSLTLKSAAGNNGVEGIAIHDQAREVLIVKTGSHATTFRQGEYLRCARLKGKPFFAHGRDQYELVVCIQASDCCHGQQGK